MDLQDLKPVLPKRKDQDGPCIVTLSYRDKLYFLFLLFLGLKLADRIDWSWWWVCAPPIWDVLSELLRNYEPKGKP